MAFMVKVAQEIILFFPTCFRGNKMEFDTSNQELFYNMSNPGVSGLGCCIFLSLKAGNPATSFAKFWSLKLGENRRDRVTFPPACSCYCYFQYLIKCWTMFGTPCIQMSSWYMDAKLQLLCMVWIYKLVWSPYGTCAYLHTCKKFHTNCCKLVCLA